ncbi:MAG: hypothetical protein U0T33_01835 [Bacteroidales bacterium]
MLLFGIYPGSGVSDYSGPGAFFGPPDDKEKISDALSRLQAPGKPFLIRCYTGFDNKFFTPEGVEKFLSEGRKLDIAICYRSVKYEKEAWFDFIRDLIKRYGPSIYSLQITEEPNNPDASTGGDGGSDKVINALVDGVVEAKRYALENGFDFLVGFNAVISFNPSDQFWPTLAALLTPEFNTALDYVGLDFYPGVFRPLPPGMTLSDASKAVISHFRKNNLSKAQIPASIPLHITENGWPTSEERSCEEQVRSVMELIESVHSISAEYNIKCYEYFDLRDANSLTPGFRHGLMNDDYTPKPAFGTFRDMISRYTTDSF